MTREHRTAFFCVVTNGEDVIEGLVLKFLHMLRAVSGNIDTKFFHDGYCFWPHMPGSRSCTLNFEAISRIMPEQSFSHLASSGISGAENQYSFLHLFAHEVVKSAGVENPVECGRVDQARQKHSLSDDGRSSGSSEANETFPETFYFGYFLLRIDSETLFS